MNMNIKGEWKDPCQECGALDGCCATAKDRLETANELGSLVRRQSAVIDTLQNDIREAWGVIEDLRRAKATT